jgi:hypothetical protein
MIDWALILAADMADEGVADPNNLRRKGMVGNW